MSQPHVSCEYSTGLTPIEVRNSRLYTTYLTNLGFWRLLSFRVTWAVAAVRNKGTEQEYKDIILMFAEVEVRDEDNRLHKSGFLLRGETVEILPIIIDPDGKRYTAFVSQARVPAGRVIKSTPAGMVDGNTRSITVLKELEEELGRPVAWNEPVWLNRPITGSDEPLWVSPGGSAETVSYCFTTTRLSHDEIAGFHGHTAGNAAEGEHTVTSIAPLDELPEGLDHYDVHDGKTTTSILMYHRYMQQLRGSLE